MNYLLDQQLLDGVASLELSHELTLYRRVDGERWRVPLSRSNLIKKMLFYSTKNQTEVRAESVGEGHAFRLLEVLPAIKSFREQNDLVRLATADGEFIWAIIDASCISSDDMPVWIECKYLHTIDQQTSARLRMFRDAFDRAGYRHAVIDEGWCSHPVVLRNIRIALAHRTMSVPEELKQIVLAEINTGISTFESCREVLSTMNRPTDAIYALLAQGHVSFDIAHPYHPKLPVLPVTVPAWLKVED